MDLKILMISPASHLVRTENEGMVLSVQILPGYTSCLFSGRLQDFVKHKYVRSFDKWICDMEA